jgi:hypothetical protein
LPLVWAVEGVIAAIPPTVAQSKKSCCVGRMATSRLVMATKRGTEHRAA